MASLVHNRELEMFNNTWPPNDLIVSERSAKPVPLRSEVLLPKTKGDKIWDHEGADQQRAVPDVVAAG